MPVKEDDQVIALIVISEAYDERLFSDDDIELLSRFADLAAMAIQNANLMQQERTLREVSNAIKSNLTLEEVADIILIEWHKVIEFRKATIQLFEGKERTLLAYHGFDHEGIDQWLLRPISEDCLVSHIVESKEPLILTHSQQHADWEVRACTSDVKSWVGLPLIYGEEVIGLLTLDHDHPGFYTELHRDQLVLFANQTAVAIQKAHLLESTQRRNRDLEIVNNIVEIISGQLELDKLLETIIFQIRQQLNGTHCAFFWPEKENGERLLVPKVMQGDYSEQIKSRRFKADEGIAGWVFREGKSVVLSDARNDSRFAPARKRQYEPRSLLVVPVKVDDQTIGVISADQDVADWFSQHDKRFMETLARHAGIAIERANLFEQIQSQREAQARAIHEIANSIPSKKPLQETLESILDSTLSLMGEASLGEIRLFDENTNEVVVEASHGELRQEFRRLPVGTGITGWVAEHKTYQLIGDVRKDKRYVQFLEETRSELAVPMLKKDKLIGVLNIEHPELNAFTEEDQKLAEAIAGLAVVAIENHRLFEQLDDRATRLEHLQQVTTIISSEPSDLEKVLQLIVDSLSQIFSDSPCVIRLYDTKKDEFSNKVAQTTAVPEEQTRKKPRSNGISRYVLKTKAPYYVEDSDHMPATGRPTIRKTIVDQGIRAMAALPLKSENEVIGVLYLNLKKPHQFTQNDQQILKLFANQAVVAVKNAQLYEQIQAQSEAEIKAIGEIASSIAIDTPIAPHEVLRKIIKSMAPLMGRSNLFNVRLLDQETNELVHIVSEGEMAEGSPLRIKVGDGVTGWVAQHKKPQRVPDVRQDERYIFGLVEGRSELAIPMLKGDELIGVLNIEHPEVNAFTKSDMQLAEAIAGLAVVALENNQLQDAREKAAAADKLAVMGHVAAEFVHRMNNLAGTIPVRVNLAKEYLDYNNPRDAKIIKQLDRIGNDTHLLLQAAQKIKRTSEQREPEDVVVNQLLEQAVEIVSSSQPEADRKIKVEKKFALDLPVLHLDRRYLLDCLVSVIRNAVQAMPNGGTLSLSTITSTMKGQPCVKISIKDNGVGISAESLPKIFEMFFTTKERGLGYGLWRDKTLIKKLGGNIKVESTEGVGSTFTINVPVVSYYK